MFVASVREDGYFILSQDKQNQIQFLSRNIASRTIPDKANLELINYGHILQIEKVQLIKMWAAPLDCALAKAVLGTAN